MGANTYSELHRTSVKNHQCIRTFKMWISVPTYTTHKCNPNISCSIISMLHYSCHTYREQSTLNAMTLFMLQNGIYKCYYWCDSCYSNIYIYIYINALFFMTVAATKSITVRPRPIPDTDRNWKWSTGGQPWTGWSGSRYCRRPNGCTRISKTDVSWFPFCMYVSTP